MNDKLLNMPIYYIRKKARSFRKFEANNLETLVIVSMETILKHTGASMMMDINLNSSSQF